MQIRFCEDHNSSLLFDFNFEEIGTYFLLWKKSWTMCSLSEVQGSNKQKLNIPFTWAELRGLLKENDYSFNILSDSYFEAQKLH